MKPVLLIDIGSTYTKVTAIDVEGAEILGRAAAPTTAQTDMSEGLRLALRRLEEACGRRWDFGEKWAASSAAGGLRLVAIGLVPELTAEAARRAALGAGARVLRAFAYRMDKADVQELERLEPDVILLAGGTDGGNRDVVLHNARQVAASRCRAPVVVACNRDVAEEVSRILEEGGNAARVASNVMPALGSLEVEGARAAIREVFLETIVKAKGLHNVEALVNGVLMPTPAAVLAAARLLSEGIPSQPGWGELLVVDVGGATTDVHSLGEGKPTRPGVTLKGLPEPFAKRTVEGDLGVRVSAEALVEAVGAAPVARWSGWSPQAVLTRARYLSRHPHVLAHDEASRRFDTALARVAVEEAVRRHAGRLQEVATPLGIHRFQWGKDLSSVGWIIGTGGVIIHHQQPEEILAGALVAGSEAEKRVAEGSEGQVLGPSGARLVVDARYVLSAAGLLAQNHPRAAMAMMNRYLQEIGEPRQEKELGNGKSRAESR